MLDYIRRHRTLFISLFAVVGIGMIVTMLGTTSSGGAVNPGGNLFGAGYAARVESEKITQPELVEELNRRFESAQRYLSQQMKDLPPDQAEQNRRFMESMIKAQVNPASVLDMMIEQRFRFITARQIGLSASKESIQKAIQELPYFQENDKFDPLRYHQVLSQNRIEPAKFEAQVAQSVESELLGELFQAVMNRRSPAETKEREFLNQERIFEIVEVNPKDLTGAPKPSKDDVSTFASNPLNQDRITNYYNQNSAKYKKSEQVRAKHILITGDSAETQAKDVLQKIQSGALSFDDAAKAHSQDPSNAQKGGDLGFFGRGMMDPAFEAAAFSLKEKGERTANPVKTSFGFHLIELVERQEAQDTPLETVKLEIAEALAAEDSAREFAEKTVNAWLAAGTIPAAELKNLKLEWKKQKPWKASEEFFPGVGKLNDEDLPLVLALKTPNAFLKKRLFRGEVWVMARFVSMGSSKPVKASETKIAADEMGPSQDELNYFLDRRKKALVESKKIVKNDKFIQDLSAQLETR